MRSMDGTQRRSPVPAPSFWESCKGKSAAGMICWVWLSFASIGIVFVVVCKRPKDYVYGRAFWWLAGSSCLLLCHLAVVVKLLDMEPNREWGSWKFTQRWGWICSIQMVMMAFGILINEFIYNADVTAYILLGFCFYALFVSQACRFPVQLGATSALLGSTAIMAWAPWKKDGERHPVEAGIITFVLILICILRHGLAGDPPHNNRNR